MGIIREEIEHPDFAARIEVIEHVKGETVEPWKIIEFSMDGFDTMSPKEIRELGKWLYQQGRRIGREYKSNGAPRVAPNNSFNLTPGKPVAG